MLKETLSLQIDDGLLFHPKTMAVEAITEAANYPGQRVKITCTLGSIRTVVKLDIGFGDVVYPGPVQMEYPMLLQSEAFEIYAYSLESTIAEKFEAMIILDARNSRMKDFFDVYELITRNDLPEDSLKEAILRTMRVRNTPTPENPAVFSREFAESLRNHQLWQAFLKRTKVEGPDFSEAVRAIRSRLEPIYRDIVAG